MCLSLGGDDAQSLLKQQAKDMVNWLIFNNIISTIPSEYISFALNEYQLNLYFTDDLPK